MHLIIKEIIEDRIYTKEERKMLNDEDELFQRINRIDDFEDGIKMKSFCIEYLKLQLMKWIINLHKVLIKRLIRKKKQRQIVKVTISRHIVKYS